MGHFRLRGPMALAVALALGAPRVARAEYRPVLNLMPEGATPELQVLPSLVDARKKKKKKKPAAPPPEEGTPAPDLGTTPAQPETTPAPEPATTDVPPATPSPAANSAGGDMNFDLLGESAKPRQPTAAELAIQQQAEIRRTTLTIHQTAGLATLGLLAATVLVGQLNYMDKFSGNAPANTGRWEATHTVLAFATLGGFATTGMLGLFAPVPYDKP